MGKFFEDFGKYLFVTICAIILWDVCLVVNSVALFIMLPIAIATILTFCVNGLRFLFSK